MGTTKKIKIYKPTSRRKVKTLKTKPRWMTDAQWKTLTQTEIWFPQKLAKANEMLANIKFMEPDKYRKLSKS